MKKYHPDITVINAICGVLSSRYTLLNLARWDFIVKMSN